MAKFIEKFLVESLVKFGYVHVWYGWLVGWPAVVVYVIYVRISK